MANERVTNEHKLELRRVLNATREEVFAAWTNPTSMAAWMLPGPDITTKIIELDLRVGGALHIAMTGTESTTRHRGTFQEITPPSRLVFTWRSTVTHDRDTLVTVELNEHPNGTELVLTHSEFPDQIARNKHEGGWSHILEELARLVQSHD